MTIRVLLADDQPLLRTGFRMILEAEPDLTVVGEATDGARAIELTRALRPDVVLMDIRMPGTDGIEATRQILSTGGGGTGPPPLSRVLVLTTFDLDEYIIEALRAGASGFLLKDVPADDLIGAIRVIAAGEAIISPTVTRKLLDWFASRLPPAGNARHPAPDTTPSTLTGRESEVFRLMAKGLSNAEIAGTLVVSETTVKTHVGNVLAKLGLRDRIQAVVYAYETGVIQPGARPQPEERVASRGKDADLPPDEAHRRRQLHAGRPRSGQPAEPSLNEAQIDQDGIPTGSTPPGMSDRPRNHPGSFTL